MGRYHSTSHLGTMNIDRFMVTSDFRTSVTLGDLTVWAELFAAKHQVAIYRKNEVQIRTYEENMAALAEYADLITTERE